MNRRPTGRSPVRRGERRPVPIESFSSSGESLSPVRSFSSSGESPSPVRSPSPSPVRESLSPVRPRGRIRPIRRSPIRGRERRESVRGRERREPSPVRSFSSSGESLSPVRPRGRIRPIRRSPSPVRELVRERREPVRGRERREPVRGRDRREQYITSDIDKKIKIITQSNRPSIGLNTNLISTVPVQKILSDKDELEVFQKVITNEFGNHPEIDIDTANNLIYLISKLDSDIVITYLDKNPKYSNMLLMYIISSAAYFGNLEVLIYGMNYASYDDDYKYEMYNLSKVAIYEAVRGHKLEVVKYIVDYMSLDEDIRPDIFDIAMRDDDIFKYLINNTIDGLKIPINQQNIILKHSLNDNYNDSLFVVNLIINSDLVDEEGISEEIYNLSIDGDYALSKYLLMNSKFDILSLSKILLDRYDNAEIKQIVKDVIWEKYGKYMMSGEVEMLDDVKLKILRDMLGASNIKF